MGCGPSTDCVSTADSLTKKLQNKENTNKSDLPKAGDTGDINQRSSGEQLEYNEEIQDTNFSKSPTLIQNADATSIDRKSTEQQDSSTKQIEDSVEQTAVVGAELLYKNNDENKVTNMHDETKLLMKSVNCSDSTGTLTNKSVAENEKESECDGEKTPVSTTVENDQLDNQSQELVSNKECNNERIIVINEDLNTEGVLSKASSDDEIVYKPTVASTDEISKEEANVVMNEIENYSNNLEQKDCSYQFNNENSNISHDFNNSQCLNVSSSNINGSIQIQNEIISKASDISIKGTGDSEIWLETNQQQSGSCIYDNEDNNNKTSAANGDFYQEKMNGENKSREEIESSSALVNNVVDALNYKDGLSIVNSTVDILSSNIKVNNNNTEENNNLSKVSDTFFKDSGRASQSSKTSRITNSPKKSIDRELNNLYSPTINSNESNLPEKHSVKSGRASNCSRDMKTSSRMSVRSINRSNKSIDIAGKTTSSSSTNVTVDNKNRSESFNKHNSTNCTPTDRVSSEKASNKSDTSTNKRPSSSTLSEKKFDAATKQDGDVDVKLRNNKIKERDTKCSVTHTDESQSSANKSAECNGCNQHNVVYLNTAEVSHSPQENMLINMSTSPSIDINNNQSNSAYQILYNVDSMSIDENDRYMEIKSTENNHSSLSESHSPMIQYPESMHEWPKKSGEY